MFTKPVISLLALIGCLWPFWLWWGAYALIGPESDVARVLIVGLGLWFLGALQIIFLVVFFFALAFIWNDR